MLEDETVSRGEQPPGPFLMAVAHGDENGRPILPEALGGGVGVERTLLALTQGKYAKKVDDRTFFGKNLDSHPMFVSAVLKV